MDNKSSIDDCLSLDIIPNDVIKYIIKFIPQVYLLSVIRVNKRISNLALSTIVNKSFLNACRNGDIITLFRYHKQHVDYYCIGAQEIIYGNNFDLVKMIYDNNIYLHWSSNMLWISEANRDVSSMYYTVRELRAMWIENGLACACRRKIFDPFTHRITYDYVDMIEYFINKNVVKNLDDSLTSICNNDSGRSSNNICRQLQIDAIKLVLNKGAIDVHCNIYFTVDVGYLEITKLLIDRPTNKVSVNKLLDYAIHCNNTDSINFIIERGGYDLNKCLKRACVNQRLDIADKLIQLGADPTKCTNCRGSNHAKFIRIPD